MGRPLVGILIGSKAEFAVLKKGLEALRAMGVPYHLELASPLRSVERVRQFAVQARESGLEVLICAASGTGDAPALLAAHTILPVIAVPVETDAPSGKDCLATTAQAPLGMPVATVGINAAENAVLLATRILAAKHESYRAVLQHQRETATRKLEASFADLAAEYPELCDPARTSPSPNANPVPFEDETDPGPEDVTPDPPATQTGEGTVAPIRPGARLSPERSPRPPFGWLVPTPQPQEPGTATEDAELAAEMEREALEATPPPADTLPPPPPDHDLLPAGAGKEEAGKAKVKTPLPDAPAPAIADNAAGKDLLPHRETKIFEIDHESPDEDVLTHAMMVLLEGGIVALPTDTVYGLAVDATNLEAIQNLYSAKGHNAQQKSLSVLIHESSMLDTLVREVPPAVESLMEAYWPGGLTILFYRHPGALRGISDQPSVAIRIPHDTIPLRLMGQLNRPLAVINAALGNTPAAINAHEVIDRFYGRIDCVLDAGPCRSAQTSTVMSVLTEPYEILREGAIPRRDLKKRLGDLLKD